MPKKDSGERTQRTWQFHNGIALTIVYAVKTPPNAAAIEEFLATALSHFKERRDSKKEQIYKAGPWEAYAIDRTKIRGTGYLTHTGDPDGKFLSTDLWVRSLAVAYSAANTLSQMNEQLAAYKAALTPDDDWLPEVIAALEKRNGDMDAFELMMKHQIKMQKP